MKKAVMLAVFCLSHSMGRLGGHEFQERIQKGLRIGYAEVPAQSVDYFLERPAAFTVQTLEGVEITSARHLAEYLEDLEAQASAQAPAGVATTAEAQAATARAAQDRTPSAVRAAQTTRARRTAQAAPQAPAQPETPPATPQAPEGGAQAQDSAAPETPQTSGAQE